MVAEDLGKFRGESCASLEFQHGVGRHNLWLSQSSDTAVLECCAATPKFLRFDHWPRDVPN